MNRVRETKIGNSIIEFDIIAQEEYIADLIMEECLMSDYFWDDLFDQVDDNLILI